MDAPEKLAEFLKRSGETHEEFARRVGVATPMVSLYLSRKRRPGLEAAFGIEDATGGEIPARSWLKVAVQSKKTQARSSRRRAARRSTR